MARKTLTFALLALLAITAHAQHFDWVKHYHGQHDNYLSTGIMRTATDSKGNLYVMGRFTSDAAIDGTYLNPLLYAQNSENRSLLVAKFSPEGQMVWHKIIYKYEYPNRADVLPLGMRLVGDSALIVMANFDTPCREGSLDHRLYYLDTLLRDSGYPYPVDSVSQWEATAFITLGLDDGSLREHHFVQVALLDTTGVPYGYQYGWQAMPLSTEDFDLDSHGNIYVVRWAANDLYLSSGDSDRPSVENGLVQGLRLIVDGQRIIDYTLSHRVGRWNQQVMKFAPHFDTLLAARYIVDSSTLLEGAADTTTYLPDIFYLQSFNIHGDNLYLCLQNNNLLDGATISGNSSMVLHARHSEGSLLKMDTNLVPQMLIQPDHWPQQENQGASSFYNTAYDADSNSLFVLADYWSRAMTITDFTPSVAYRGDTLDLCNNLCFMRFDPNDGRLLSYGKAGSSFEFRNDYYGYPGLAVMNNRVVSTLKYKSDVFFGDTMVSLADPNRMALGLAVWDYAGHEIEYHDFGAVGNSNMVGPCTLHDSSLYFAVTAFDGASFDQHVLPGANTCIVRYVDTAYAHPYKYVEQHADQNINWDDPDTIYITAANRIVELNATSSSGLPVVYRLSNPNMCRLLSNNQLWINDTGICLITAVQPGNSYWNAATPKVKVLSVGIEEWRIVWTQPLEFSYSDTVIALDAHFIYGGSAIEYTLPAYSGVAEISEFPNKLHLLGPGTIEIDAHCPYNPNSSDHLYHCIRTLIVHPAESNGIDIATDELCIVYPNPFRQSVRIKFVGAYPRVSPQDGTVTAILTDLTGRREVVRLIPTGPGQYTLDLTTRPQATYLLTLTTADGRQHTVRLLKQSDIFGQ